VTAPVVLIPENPMPEGGEAFWLTAHDGARLRVFTWASDDATRGTVFLFGGRTEFIEKYFEVVGELRLRGFSVVTMDWRGQGLSERMLADPRKGHIDDFSTYDRDLARLMEEVAPRFPKPWIGFAHSMGGQILLRAAHDRPDWFSRIVLSAPMFGLRFTPAMMRMVRGVTGLLHFLRRNGDYVPGGNDKATDEAPFAGNILTQDPERYAVTQALIRAEPKLGLGSTTVGWLHAAFRTIDQTSRPYYLAAIETPLLIFEAGRDALVAPDALARAAEHMPDVRLVAVPEARHEILIERDECRAIFWDAFDDFVAGA
jgi:lysophospholipase